MNANVIEALLKLGIEERECVAARLQVKLHNNVAYLATYHAGEFAQQVGVWNSGLEAWSSIPATTEVKDEIVSLLAAIEEGKPANPDHAVELVFIGCE